MKFIKNFSSKTFASLATRNYRLYFIGQAISFTGTWMQTVAQGWLVLKLTGSGTALGIITALQYLPILIFGPMGGVFADRYAKRKILYITQSVSAILALILGVLVLFNSIQLWMVGVLALGLGLVNALDGPVRQTFVMEMVGKDQLANAVSLNAILMNVARVLGPAIAGIVIAVTGLGLCFILNSISFAAVIIVLFLMDATKFHHLPLAEKTKGQLIEGLRYVNSNIILKNTILMMLIIGTLTYEFTISLPLFAQFALHGDATTYSMLTAAMGLGSVVGGLVSASISHLKPQKLVSIAFFFGISVLAASFMPNIVSAMIALVIVGFFSVTFTSLGNVTLQMESVPQMRGRVMALWAVAFLGSTPIGGPIVGWVGEQFGSRWGLIIGGLAAIFAAFIGRNFLKSYKTYTISEAVEMRAEQTPTEKNSRNI